MAGGEGERRRERAAAESQVGPALDPSSSRAHVLLTDGGRDVVLSLPEAGRASFKDPFGPVYADVESLLEAHSRPIVAVGDMVTYHLEQAGHQPNVAFVDGRTKRETAPVEVRETLDDLPNRIDVANPAGTVTIALLEATVSALAADEPTTVAVDGEEDLAAVPAVLAAPDGSTVVYGQPDEGMVAVDVNDANREAFRELLDVFDGDVDRALAELDA